VYFLRRLEYLWPGANRCTGIVEEYVEFTLEFLERGPNGPCAFHHEKNELTGLELSDGSGRFPPDLAELNLKRLPGQPLPGSRFPSIRTESNANPFCRDRTMHSRSNQVRTNDNLPTSQAESTDLNASQPNYSAPSSNLNSSRFALPRKRLAGANFNGAKTTAASYSLPSDNDRFYHGGDPTCSWGIEATDSSFDSLLNAEMNPNTELLFDNTAPFIGEGFWGLG